MIYFTFDDGPRAVYTPRILNILRREHVNATFFILGNRCNELPGVVRRFNAKVMRLVITGMTIVISTVRHFPS